MIVRQFQLLILLSRSLLPVLLIAFVPKTIAIIPAGNVKYQNNADIIEIIPNTNEVTSKGDLFSFSYIFFPPSTLFLILLSILNFLVCLP